MKKLLKKIATVVGVVILSLILLGIFVPAPQRNEGLTEYSITAEAVKKAEEERVTAAKKAEEERVAAEEKAAQEIADRAEATKREVEAASNTYIVSPQPSTATNCANGTYINTDGNTVCRPSSSNTGGATAICKDGTYSYSQNNRGTCSKHGGVQTWL